MANPAPLTIDNPNLFHKFVRQVGDNPEVMQGWLQASNPRKYIFGKLTETLDPLENSIMATIDELQAIIEEANDMQATIATLAETLTPETIGNP